MSGSDDVPASDPHRDEDLAKKRVEGGEAAGVDSEAESASKTRKQIRALRWIVTIVAVMIVVFLMAIIAAPLFGSIGLPPPGLATYLYIISGIAPVVALTTIVAMLLLGVFRGFHGKDMDDGLGPAALKELVKGASGQD